MSAHNAHHELDQSENAAHEAAPTLAFDAARRRLAARASIETQPDVMPVEAILEMGPADNPATRYLAGRNAREISMVQYRRSLRLVQRRLAESGFSHGDDTVPAEEFPWHLVGPAEATAFVGHVTREYPNEHSRAILIVTLRGLIKLCARVELIGPRRYDSVIEILRVPSVHPKRSGREISDDELGRLFGAARSGKPFFAERDEAMMAVLLSTGIRSSELVDLDLEHLDQTTHELIVLKTKSGRSLLTWLHPEAMGIMDAWLAVRGSDPGPLFTNPKGGRVATMTFRQRMQRLVKRAGIERVTPHDFRRTCITRLLREGVDPFVVARLVGHSKVSTTLIYDRRTELEDRDALLDLDLGVLRSSRRKKAA